VVASVRAGSACRERHAVSCLFLLFFLAGWLEEHQVVPEVLLRANLPGLFRAEKREIALLEMLLHLDFVPSVGQVNQGVVCQELCKRAESGAAADATGIVSLLHFKSVVLGMFMWVMLLPPLCLELMPLCPKRSSLSLPIHQGARPFHIEKKFIKWRPSLPLVHLLSLTQISCPNEQHRKASNEYQRSKPLHLFAPSD
jgi:hypothetical protein